MGSFCSFFLLLMVSMPCFSSSPAYTSQVHVQFSAISAAPAFLLEAPLSSSSPPTSSLSPDIEPVFPTTGAAVPSPADLSLPTIPSSPSPPNPDVIDPAAGPLMAISPSGSLPAFSAATFLSSIGLPLYFLGLLVFCLMQLPAL